jgi:hypothetical protein
VSNEKGAKAMRLYEYAVLYHPGQTKLQKDRGEAPKSKIVQDVTRLVARDEKEVMLIAARSIPKEYLDKLNQVEVAVRPF